jgi:hypothetical protein
VFGFPYTEVKRTFSEFERSEALIAINRALIEVTNMVNVIAACTPFDEDVRPAKEVEIELCLLRVKLLKLRYPDLPVIVEPQFTKRT